MITKKSPFFKNIYLFRINVNISNKIKWRFLLHYHKMITFLATNLEKNRNRIKGLNKIYIYIIS